VHLFVVAILSPGEGTGPTPDGESRCGPRAPTRRKLHSNPQTADALGETRLNPAMPGGLENSMGFGLNRGRVAVISYHADPRLV